jgi:hypothetical protein
MFDLIFTLLVLLAILVYTQPLSEIVKAYLDEVFPCD